MNYSPRTSPENKKQEEEFVDSHTQNQKKSNQDPFNINSFLNIFSDFQYGAFQTMSQNMQKQAKKMAEYKERMSSGNKIVQDRTPDAIGDMDSKQTTRTMKR